MAEPLGHGQPQQQSRLGAGGDRTAVAITEFGRAVANKLGRGGNPEDQLRGPLEVLFKRLGIQMGLDAIAYGEVRLKTLRARPDYAVDVGSSRVGYIELKAPGRSVPGTAKWRANKHEREQWEKLRALPNVIYSDGICWGRYEFGELQGSIVELGGTLHDDRKPLHLNDHRFEALIWDFLCWEPERPRSLAELITIVAGLCRLLRDEVLAILVGSTDHAAYEDLTLLAADWRDLLFPGLDDEGFADAYSQTITYAMLLARVDGISFGDTSIHEIARQLAKKHLLIGRAFAVLTDSDATEELRTIETLRRVIGAVDWTILDDGKSDIYVELYERFLAEYDPERRKESGSYYTPEPVARFMVDFVDQILRDKLRRTWGFADDKVRVVDPAMGTGTFLVEIVRSVADTVARKQGVGARPERLRSLFSKRLVGFEIQVAPYAIAELRLHQALKNRFDTDIPSSEVRFLTDALENPREQQERLRAPYKIIEKSRSEANRIKRDEQVMVVIGNPPHVENTKGQAPWIEEPRDPKHQPPPIRTRPSLDEFRADGLGRYESDLHGLPWLYWRWALWKVFEAHPDHPSGIVAFITPASLIKGKAFSGIREYLRRVCDEGWIIELSPEGNRPKANTRIFGPKVGRQLCIAIFMRRGDPDPNHSANIHHILLEGTSREKLDRLRTFQINDADLVTCRDGWRTPFLPNYNPEWDRYPALADLMPWRSRGVTTGRTWVYAPTRDVLIRRWRELTTADHSLRRELFKEGRDRKIDSKVPPLPGYPRPGRPLSEEHEDCPEPTQVAYRSFDRQWVIPDNRLMEMPRPPLWAVRSADQIYITEQDSHPIDSGPALIFTSLIPDLDHFNGRAGGVRPLYRDPEALIPNCTPHLSQYLSSRLGFQVAVQDLLAYVAAVTAHPGYTAKFQLDLRQPGARIPLTANPDLWAEAVSIGQELIWLHTFGVRFVDEEAGRPRGALALAEKAGIRNLAAILSVPTSSSLEEPYDARTKTLHVGGGIVGPVDPTVWEYSVGGMRVIRHWLNYRTTEPRYKRISSRLDGINVGQWSYELTDELLALIGVLTGCVALEQRQTDLLTQICEGPLIPVSDLVKARVLPVPRSAGAAPSTEILPAPRLPMQDR